METKKSVGKEETKMLDIKERGHLRKSQLAGLAGQAQIVAKATKLQPGNWI